MKALKIEKSDLMETFTTKNSNNEKNEGINLR